MNNIMSPSMQESDRMTHPQIDKAADVLRAILRKHQSEFPTDAAQQAVTAKGLGPDLLAVFRKYVERFSSLITRLVQVNRSRTPEQAIAATNRKQYTDSSVVASMPRGKGSEAKVIFFKPEACEYTRPGFMSDDDLEKAFEHRNFTPAPPDDVWAVNEADPAFANEHPNATHWKDVNGKWCYAAFCRWSDGGRGVLVLRGDDVWPDSWWFAGLASQPSN